MSQITFFFLSHILCLPMKGKGRGKKREDKQHPVAVVKCIASCPTLEETKSYHVHGAF